MHSNMVFFDNMIVRGKVHNQLIYVVLIQACPIPVTVAKHYKDQGGNKLVEPTIIDPIPSMH